MFYSKSTNGFYTADIHGSNMPKDAFEITDDEHTRLLAGQSAGKRISGDATGAPVLVEPPVPSVADNVKAALAEARAMRQPIIVMLDGMQSSANTADDKPRAFAIQVAKRGLLDITKIDLTAHTTTTAMRAAIMLRYKAIAAALPADIRIAFAQALL